MKRGESKIRRIEDILNLPVQDPSCSEFSAVNLNWIKVDGGRLGSDDVAVIPYTRVVDFVKGESSNAECPANFRVESRRKRSEGSVSKPRVDGYLEYTLYWCSYGPEDYRDSDFGSGDFPTSKPLSGKGSRPGRRHMMRGCLCHFTVKRLYTRPHLALIVYNQRSHIDKNGMPCHGLLDRDALGTRAVYAPRISEDLRQKIVSMLYVGIPLAKIIQHHKETVERHGGPSNRDDLLTRNDVRNMERAMRHSTYELHTDDAYSVKLWVQRNQKYVFFFQESNEMEAFILGIQTEWQLQRMLQYGHNSSIVSHSNFGSKKLRYPLRTLLVFDSCQSLIPIAWVITNISHSEDSRSWMAALVERSRMKDQNWRPNAFLVDDPHLDLSLIRDTFQCRVLLCLWRVRRAWLKNLQKKCLNFDVQKEMFKQLGRILYCTRTGSNANNAVEEFMQVFVDQRAFMEYLKRRWLTEIDMWVSAMRTLPISRQELNGAIESYHLKLKSKLLSHSHNRSWDRVDWLVHTLTAEFHCIYWFYKYSEECGIFRNYIEKWFPSDSWHRAMHIPDVDVTLDEVPNFVKVVSQSDRSRAYTVWNPGSDFSGCDCPWSRAGNLCKHVIKVNILLGNWHLARPSIASQIYHQRLTDLLQNPPDDPLVLDHAMVHVTRMHHDVKSLEDLSNDGLLQPLSAEEASVLLSEGILPQSYTIAKRQRTGSPGFRLDFPVHASLLENPQIPGSNQMGEVLDLLRESQGSNLINSIHGPAFISSDSIAQDICMRNRYSE